MSAVGVADNRLSEALDAVLGLLPPTVWTMSLGTARQLVADVGNATREAIRGR